MRPQVGRVYKQLLHECCTRSASVVTSLSHNVSIDHEKGINKPLGNSIGNVAGNTLNIIA